MAKGKKGEERGVPATASLVYDDHAVDFSGSLGEMISVTKALVKGGTKIGDVPLGEALEGTFVGMLINDEGEMPEGGDDPNDKDEDA